MPCDSVILNRVDLPRMNPALTDRAIAMLAPEGFARVAPGVFNADGYRFTIARGRLQSSAPADVLGRVADKLKRAYSAQTVLYVAQRNGWEVRATGAYQYQVVKS